MLSNISHPLIFHTTLQQLEGEILHGDTLMAEVIGGTFSHDLSVFGGVVDL